MYDTPIFQFRLRVPTHVLAPSSTLLVSPSETMRSSAPRGLVTRVGATSTARALDARAFSRVRARPTRNLSRVILRSPARRIILVRADATNATSDDGGDGKEPLLGAGRSDGRASNANVGAQRTGSSSGLEKRTTASGDARNRDGDGRSSDTLAIEKRRENTTAIAPVIANDSSTEDEGGDEKTTTAEPARSAPTSQTAPRLALSEEELLPPSKREKRGKMSDDGADGVAGAKEGAEKPDVNGEAQATTKTKPKVNEETGTGEKVATPKSPPLTSGGSIKSAAGTTVSNESEPVLAGGEGGGDDDARGKRGGGGGGGGNDDDESDEEEEEEDDDEVIVFDPWYKLAWLEMERELTKIMQQLLNIWITRDPSKTTRLVLFSILGTGLFFASLLLYPENPLEFSDDGLFSAVFGRNPRWVINRELGPVQPTLLSTTCACAVAFAKVRLGTNMFRLSPFMHGVLGLPMGFMLVFRWNNAHERWWYGRTCLGNILFYCKNLGGTFCTWVAPDDPMLTARMLGLIGALKETVADRLNGTVLNDGAILSQLTTPLDAGDLEGLFLADNKVLFCLEQLRACVVDAFRKGYVPPAIASTMHCEVGAIMDNYGSCEKVVNQPPPGCIITHLKSTLMVYMCSLPMILVHEVGVWGVVPVTAILSLALFGIEAAAEQIEQPFGNRPYDLPVRALMNSNGRDLEQTSKKVLGMTGFVNGTKLAFVPPETPVTAPIKIAGTDVAPSKILPVPKTPTKAPEPEPKPATTHAFVAPAKSSPKVPETTTSATAVVIPGTPRDNTVSLASERLEASSVSSPAKDSPFGFTSDPPAQTSGTDAPSSPKTDSTADPARPSTPTPTTPMKGKSSLQAAMDAVSDVPKFRAPQTTSVDLSSFRAAGANMSETTSSSAQPSVRGKSELPAWKAQSPIEIYDQVLDERPSTDVPDSPRYHTQNSMRRRDSYGHQFFEMFTSHRNSGGSSSSSEQGSPTHSLLERARSAQLPRSNSMNSFHGGRDDGERDIRDMPFSRNPFGRSPSKSDIIAEEDGAVPMHRVGSMNRSSSATDMSALEEAIKRAREARKRSSVLGSSRGDDRN